MSEMDALLAIIKGLGLIALALGALVWTLMWIAFLNNRADGGDDWSRRELAFLFAPMIVLILVFSYYLGGGR